MIWNKLRDRTIKGHTNKNNEILETFKTKLIKFVKVSETKNIELFNINLNEIDNIWDFNEYIIFRKEISLE